MSDYMNYETASADYDATRIPIGVEIILGCLARGRASLSEMIVLDAGCGTGNDTRAIWRQVKRIDAVDVNGGMLRAAASKLQEPISADRVRLSEATIDELPFDDAAFDGAVVNQVLHHLPDSPADGFCAYEKALGELARTLKPGGVLVIGTCSREQVVRGFWYNHLMPPSVIDVIEQRYVPIERVKEMMSAVGLSYCGSWVPVDAIQQGAAYFNALGPLDPTWRAGDSTWAILDHSQLQEVAEKVNRLENAASLEEFVRENDRDRQSIGQVTFLCGTRNE